MQDIVHLLRTRVLKIVPNAHETVWDAANAVSLVFSPTPRWQDGICHIATYSEHVNLGFNQGGILDDPLGILEGTGNRIRHVSFHSRSETKGKWIDDYVERAMEAACMSPKDGDRGTTIRIMKGEKRRPSD